MFRRLLALLVYVPAAGCATTSLTDSKSTADAPAVSDDLAVYDATNDTITVALLKDH